MELSESPIPPPMKRRRVTQACQNCRYQKSKCDGRHPVCGRCEGYGHKCSWSSDSKGRPQSSQSPRKVQLSNEAFASQNLTEVHSAIISYDQLIRRVYPDLPETTRAAVDLALSSIRRQLPADLLSSVVVPDNSSLPSGTEDSREGLSNSQDDNEPRYLGQASDVRFFHAVKQILREPRFSGELEELGMQGYDQDAIHLENLRENELRVMLPEREVADTYIQIYFSTIHIAYPFVNKQLFMTRYEASWEPNLDTTRNSSWLSLLYTVFAIGAYYTSFPRSNNLEQSAPFQYFSRAVSRSWYFTTTCTVENVQALLAQCFFLLATGQTDRCWNTLGLAIRVAQSIGVHVVDAPGPQLSGKGLIDQEIKRRTWYSMYVLDRLLALQLGRPVAIYEEDFCVRCPSEAVLAQDALSPPTKDGPATIDYFICVIGFSGILGHVIRDLYRPSQVSLDPDQMLLSTTNLDRDLINWKLSLPRHLRFDLGHTFERSVTFRRQRNMLAIKFHHLRTLMHRPYLCLTWLQQNNRPLIALFEREHARLEALERICVLEAQQTAHLLHNVADERSLVHDFPWWQMISCLLCASSVLLAARACVQPSQPDAKVQFQTLDEDAETCLKVFDALSANSESARRARDMMKSLKQMRIISRGVAEVRPDFSSSYQGDNTGVLTINSPDGIHTEQRLDYGVRQDAFEWQGWAGELSDPVAWSAQFLDLTHHAQPDPATVSNQKRHDLENLDTDHQLVDLARI